MSMKSDTMALLITAEEAAWLLGISRAHFYKLLSSGRLPAPVNLGRSVRWARAELEAWIATGAPPRVQWEATKDSRKRA